MPRIGVLTAEQIDTRIATHKADPSAHHDEYTDAEAAAIAAAVVAAHAVLPTVHQDAPALILAHKGDASAHHARYTDAEALAAAIAGGLSKVIWEDTSVAVMTDWDRTVTLGWTDLDLTAYTSENAKLAILLLQMSAVTIGTGPYSELKARLNGNWSFDYPRLRLCKPGIVEGYCLYQEAVVGLDSGQVLEYSITVGAGWTVDSRMVVLGYIE